MGLLLLVSVAAAVWAAQPFFELNQIAPQGGAAAAGVGATTALVLAAAGVGVGILLVWLARKDAGRAVRWFMRAAIAFGLLLLLVPFVADSPWPWLWAVAIAVAANATWLLRRPGWHSWTASALAAGGYAGLLGAMARLAVLCVAVALVCAYDAWAVRRQAMGRAADAAEALGAALQVGGPARLSLGLGDLILPAAVVAAAAAPSGGGPWVAAAAVLGLALGFLALTRAVRRNGDTPGTPYLCGGALLGVALALLARAMSS